MLPETYQAGQFIIVNAKSYDGILDVRVIYDNLQKQHLVDVGDFSLVVSAECAAELIKEIPNM